MNATRKDQLVTYARKTDKAKPSTHEAIVVEARTSKSMIQVLKGNLKGQRLIVDNEDLTAA